ncbi:MAG: hypothetical protein H7175_02100, partial [Burkholderiales bacterium]|nr:hypothetical protein [Anaerolineae bacterium]
AEEAGQLADIGRITLPENVLAGGMQAVIQRRLDTVPSSARRLMTAAAVVGREIDLNILSVLMPDVDMEVWLQQVATVIEVLDNRYRFAHDKLRDGILSLLDADERRQLHREIGGAIESAYPDSPEQYAALAYHWEQAQDFPKTIHYSMLAGQDSLRSGSYRQAIRYYEHALALTEQSPLDRREMANLYYLLGDANWGQSDRRQSYEWHTKALGLLGYDVPQEAKSLLLHTLPPLLRHIARRLPRNRRPAANHEELLAAAKSLHQITLGSYHDANFALGLYCILNGIDTAERSGRSLEAMRLRVRYYTFLGFGMGDVSVHRLADYYMKLAAKRLKQYPDPETQAWFNFVTGVYFAGRAQWDESNRLFAQAQQISVEIGSIQLWHEISEVAVAALRLQSRFSDALDEIETMAHVAIREDHTQAIGRYYMFKTRLLFLQGKTGDARQAYFDNEAAIAAAMSGGEQIISRTFVYGFLTDMYARNEEWDAALKAAETLNGIIASAQTVAFVLAGDASASIGLYLTLWEQQGTAEYGRMAETMLKMFQLKYARHHEVGRAIYHMYRCWYFWLKGDEKQARSAGAQAIQSAQTYKMPYYEAAAFYHLARFMANDDPERAFHLATAATLFDQIGAAYDAELSRQTPRPASRV